MRQLALAVLQLALARADEADNIAAVAALVEEAAGKGAQVILPPELFSGEYFCREEEEALFALARPTAQHPSVIAMQKLAKAHGVAIPTSFFERDGHHYYNTLAMIGPDGELMGTYRKSHIPDGPGLRGKVLFPPRQRRVQGVGTRSVPRSASGSAGISGIPNARAPWR